MLRGRFAIKTVALCRSSGLLVVGGMAGQLLLCHLDIKREFDIPVTEVKLGTDDIAGNEPPRGLKFYNGGEGPSPC